MDAPHVKRCPRSERADALRMLHAAAAPGQQASLAQAVASAAASDDAWEGLFLAGDSCGGAIWVQPTPGNTAIVWPPSPWAPASSSLFQAAAAFVDERGIALAQMIVAEDEGFSPQRLAACGFPKLADLLYLFAELAHTLRRPPGLAHFVPHAGDEPDRLAELVERTYLGTEDCPALDGIRPTSDVLAGYRAQGRFLAEHWYAIEEERGAGDAVGVLILADHPAAGNWELVYMGVVPEARGRGLGNQIVHYARQTAARHGAQRLVLAVDAANAPALAMYRRTGFSEWDRRTVYARLASPPLAA
jgi:ribosomal protein S18 acetylase RimI-like enzyme